MRAAARSFRVVALFAVLGSIGLGFARPTSADAGLRAIEQRAHQAIRAGDYESAIAAFEDLERAGVADPNIYYDRALAHLRLNELGKAIVWLERARFLAPFDAEIQSALAQTTSLLREERENENHGEPLYSPESFLTSTTALIGKDLLGALALFFEFVCFISVFLLISSQNERLRIALGLVSSFSFILFLAMLVGIGARLEWFSEGNRAVLVAKEAVLRAGPDEAAEGRRIIREGDRFLVIGERRGFYEVRLPDADRGFLERDSLLILRPKRTD